MSTTWLRPFKIVSFLMLLGCLASCSSKQGSFCGDRYTDHYEWFSVDVPGQDRSMIQEHQTESLSAVIFHDCWGGLTRIEVSPFPEDLFNQMCTLENTIGGREEILKQLFNECCYRQIQSQMPDTKLTHEEFVTLEDEGKAYYAILEIPGGGTITNAGTGEAQMINSTRGYLAFFSKKQLVVISMQESPVFQEIKKRRGTDDDSPEKLLNELLNVKKRYRNEQDS